MALNETAKFTSPIKLGSTNVAIIFGTGAPDGDSSPQSDAVKGSLYIRTDATDDYSPIYVKVDESSADDDWVVLIASNDGGSRTISSDWTVSTDKKIQFRDTGIFIQSNSDGYGKLQADTAWRIGDGTNYIEILADGEMRPGGRGFVNPAIRFDLSDDFVYQAISENDTPWILNKGSDGSAADPAIAAGVENGAITLTTGAGDGSTAQDGSQLVAHIPMQADSGGLIFEARLHINTAITNIAINAGFTDNTALEEPFTIAGGDAITSNASNGACFTYDTSADTDEWFMCAVDGDTDDTGIAATGTAPVADTYQILRIESESDGNTIRFYIDGTLEGTLTGGGMGASTNLYATVIACGDGTASKTVDLDYVFAGHLRS